MMTTLTVCEQIFVFSIPSSDRIVFACAQHSTLHTAAHGSMLDDSVLLLMMPTNVARLVMLVSIHSYTHSQHTPNELFCRIAANDCVISAACVCAKRGGIKWRKQAVLETELNQRREQHCRARCWFGVRASRLLSVRIDAKRLWSRDFLHFLCTAEIWSVPVWFVYTPISHILSQNQSLGQKKNKEKTKLKRIKRATSKPQVDLVRLLFRNIIGRMGSMLFSIINNNNYYNNSGSCYLVLNFSRRILVVLSQRIRIASRTKTVDKWQEKRVSRT